ncbi:SCC4 [Scenedesmus sp. PABB004]|nr:SCC4 [Scenedesmus sp. PABB004]
MAAAAEVQGTLQALAARLAGEGHHMQAIKAYTALLGLSLPPADEAGARLRLSALLLEHAANGVPEAKQHLQKAEMLVAGLPGQALLKCEVLAALGRAHKFLGETAFQRQCYAKGLQLCTAAAGGAAGASSSSRRGLAEWGVYFHLHSAESFTLERQPHRAAEHAARGRELAAAAGLAEQQLLCVLFQLQLVMLTWERQAFEQLAPAAVEALQQLEQAPGAGGAGGAALLKLHLTVLQVLMAIRQGNFQELAPADANPPPIVAELEGQLEALPREQLPYCWLPRPCLGALVQLLAATILKPGGKVKPAQLHISRGLSLVDEQLSALGLPPDAGEAALDHVSLYDARAALVLRLHLLEARQQLHLLCSDFAAARHDAAQSAALLQRFPGLLGHLRPCVHLQAGLYAQAVGDHGAALAHFERAGASSDAHLRAAGRCLAALAALAQDAPGAVGRARELLGDLAVAGGGGEGELGYVERALANVAGGLVALAAPDASADETADAKQRLSKGLKLAHGRLQNHQLVSQVLLFMAPLQVGAADSQGALAMVSSSFTLAKGAGDLAAQVAGLSMMQQLYHHARAADKAAQNFNYLGRKQEELSARIQEAEAAAAQHAAVLGWDL